uniref:NACHT, LRR and PYD domains-containing protein 12-like n=2 Tax=Acanthochromis polyacanthus TaxID=80966 RepID=A0A3Q1FUM6_9TELE
MHFQEKCQYRYCFSYCPLFSGTSMMDLQSSLKTTLKNKYQTLKEAFSKKPLLPSRCRNLSAYFTSYNFHDHELRHVDTSYLPVDVVHACMPLAEVLSCEYGYFSNRRTILTLGVSGIGKTTVVQSCALDWAEDRGHHDIQFLFPLNFWELNLLIKHKLSLIELLQMFYPELKGLNASSLNSDAVWFFFDGLDEFNLMLDFSCPSVSDVSEASTVDNLVTSLIVGSLLPNAHIWVTSRFSAMKQIPRTLMLRETELMGFNDAQKEQYFRMVIDDEELAYKAINCVRISRSLNFLCQVPSICTIMAHVLETPFETGNRYQIKPLTLTQIYTLGYNLVETSDVVSKLKKLALLRMGEGSVMYEENLLELGITVKEASIFSKKCPLLLREETGLHNTTVFRFSHVSVQEYLAASAKLDEIEASETPSLSDSCQSLVDAAVAHKQGKWDIFLRFIFGLIKERHLLEPNDLLFFYTKKVMLENIFDDKFDPLFPSLKEYDSQALVYELNSYRKHASSPISGFQPMHWEIVKERLRNWDMIEDCFEMPVSERCDKHLIRLLPTILKSKQAMLRFSNLTDDSCPALTAVLSTKESHLRELDLGYNNISDYGVGLLVDGLVDINCRLKSLRLQCCGMTFRSCEDLANGLLLTETLQELDLSRNEIGDEGLFQLSEGLKAARLKMLKLSQCNIEKQGCWDLAAALQENSKHLKVLDLSSNMVGDNGANELFTKFDISRLTKLEMYHCGLTALSCGLIGEALKSETSTLVELNLSNNKLKDAGFRAICEGMYAWSRLEKLNVSRCGITEKGCVFLAKVLCTVSQYYSVGVQQMNWQAVELRELDISMNLLGDRGVKEMSPGLQNPYSHLKTLNLSHCGLNDDCCSELASGFASINSVLSDLDLSNNDLRDRGMKKLCVGLRNPQCKLKKLSLRSCGLTSKSVQFLTSALKSNPLHLKELHLMGNKLEDPDIEVLVELMKCKKYTLRILDVSAD